MVTNWGRRAKNVGCNLVPRTAAAINEACSRSQVDEPSTRRRLRSVPPPQAPSLLVDLGLMPFVELHHRVILAKFLPRGAVLTLHDVACPPGPLKISAKSICGRTQRLTSCTQDSSQQSQSSRWKAYTRYAKSVDHTLMQRLIAGLCNCTLCSNVEPHALAVGVLGKKFGGGGVAPHYLGGNNG